MGSMTGGFASAFTPVFGRGHSTYILPSQTQLWPVTMGFQLLKEAFGKIFGFQAIVWLPASCPNFVGEWDLFKQGIKFMPGNFKDQGDTSPNMAQAKAEWIWRRRAGPGSEQRLSLFGGYRTWVAHILWTQDGQTTVCFVLINLSLSSEIAMLELCTKCCPGQGKSGAIKAPSQGCQGLLGVVHTQPVTHNQGGVWICVEVKAKKEGRTRVIHFRERWVRNLTVIGSDHSNDGGGGGDTASLLCWWWRWWW